MEFDTSLSHSAQCMKKAIPLMVKYKVPVTPLNYAIWYCYVLGSNEQLNTELERVLDNYQTCPPAHAKQLFDEFLSDKDLALFHQMSDSFQETISGVQVEIDKTLESSQDFSAVLSQCHSGLYDLKRNSLDSFDDVLGYVDRLTEESVVMQQTAYQFQKKLENAYAEISDLKSALVNTQEAASQDPLTGLLNRGKFDEDIVMFCKTAPTGTHRALIFVDIDHFKQFNDDFGHQKGDDVLKVVSAKIIKHTEGIGKAYRYGGEEFCIFAELDSLSEVVNFAEGIRKDIAKLSVKGKKTGKAVRSITASFGIALHIEQCLVTHLIERADKALYLAKEHGRNRIEIAV
ncbi:GGDEF domain-containing protein [Pseudoalteromonas aurantia]|uniref:diguanylate cyclase n=1 Tax=Pseudoalteromonas aurantia TaxID=43654 RepID=A0A5S3V7J9_9GAMM|nr:GGDEF domain-containing protein [Pseudoalteromonas aurantia]TMO62236.1 GGDEF domain-containing protein [Pseudoalteromonas aurantia]TMO67529.1 GGDEF domain-containing protein [Pseudoalteromonas aurantia]TMO73302.1 GGDEF domain-containing protein [Pseudoalteromonas aurantia]